MHTITAFTSIRRVNVIGLIHYLSRVGLVATNNDKQQQITASNMPQWTAITESSTPSLLWCRVSQGFLTDLISFIHNSLTTADHSYADVTIYGWCSVPHQVCVYWWWMLCEVRYMNTATPRRTCNHGSHHRWQNCTRKVHQSSQRGQLQESLPVSMVICTDSLLQSGHHSWHICQHNPWGLVLAVQADQFLLCNVLQSEVMLW